LKELLLALLREGATLFISREIVKRSTERAIGTIALGAVLAILSLAALAFLYLFLFRLIAADRGEEAAAAILCGGNLLLIALILIGRSLLHATGRRPAKARTNSPPGLTGADIEAALALGRGLEGRLREVAPEATIVAAILGLAVGARPELLDLLRAHLPRDRHDGGKDPGA
jgi:hypothetical protein